MFEKFTENVVVSINGFSLQYLGFAQFSEQWKGSYFQLSAADISLPPMSLGSLLGPEKIAPSLIAATHV